MSDSESLAGQLQARRVVRGAIAHVVIAWLFVQIADVVFPYLDIGDESVRWVLVVSVATFPVTLFVAWLSDQPWSGSGHPFPEAVILVLIAVAAGWWVQGNLPEGARERTSIVIMPFEHGNDDVDASLSRALTDEVASLLMRSKSIDVIAPESANSSALTGLGTVAIADRLSVGSVLEGSVTAQGDSMRIELRLLDAVGELLWTGIVEDSFSNLANVQARIALEIEQRLGTGGEQTVPIEQVAAERCWMPADANALRDYYTARYYLEIRWETEESRQQIAEAISLYEGLLEQYPAFSDARSGLAWALVRQMQWFPDDNPYGDGLEGKLLELARQAYDDCPSNGEALHILPNQYDHENSWIAAYQQGMAFIELEPHKSENWSRLAGFFRLTGLIERAFETARNHLDLNPLSVNALKNLAGIEQYHGDLDVAAELYDRMAELGWQGPNFARQQQTANECAWDVDCMAERGLLWPALRENIDLLRVVNRAPSTESEQRESIEAAMTVYASNPADTVNTLNTLACQVPHLTPLFFELWDAFRRDAPTTRMNWWWPNAWVDACADVWSDPRFVDYVEQADFVEYWREVEWPHFCQPQGESFACGRNIAAR